MVDYNEQIKDLKKEIAKTKYNKATEHHIGLVKAKIAKLQEKQEVRSSKKGKSDGYEVRKTGDGTVILVGFPSVGKSTLLNALTNAESKTGGYAFTTLTVVPGVMDYKHAKIQILDVPGIVQGAATGRGRGKEVLSVARSCDLVIIVLDVNHLNHLKVLQEEIYDFKLRLNKTPPDVTIKRTAKDGIKIYTTCKLTKISKATLKDILKEYKIMNADIIIRSNIDADDFIDVLENNRKYVPAITIINKIDMVSEDEAEKAIQSVNADLAISAKEHSSINILKKMIFDKLDLIRIYLKEPGKEADMEIPLITHKNTTIKGICLKLHKDFLSKFKFARVWGKSSKFPGQKLQPKHALADGDILEIHLR